MIFFFRRVREISLHCRYLRRGQKTNEVVGLWVDSSSRHRVDNDHLQPLNFDDLLEEGKRKNYTTNEIKQDGEN